MSGEFGRIARKNLGMKTLNTFINQTFKLGDFESYERYHPQNTTFKALPLFRFYPYV